MIKLLKVDGTDYSKVAKSLTNRNRNDVRKNVQRLLKCHKKGNIMLDEECVKILSTPAEHHWTEKQKQIFYDAAL